MPKRFFFIFLAVFLIFIISSLYFIDKIYFLCPIEYKREIIIRRDDLGSGEFAAPRARGRRHEGLDLYASIGTEVRAVRFARVTEAGFHQRLGNYVELSHTGNLTTIYGHLQRILVRQNQWVAQGKIIGYVGKTGNANHPRILPHVHFEVRKDGLPINPLDWLTDKQNPGIVLTPIRELSPGVDFQSKGDTSLNSWRTVLRTAQELSLDRRRG